MRISRYIFIVIICLLWSKFAFSKDYGGETTNRLDGREKRDWNARELEFQAEYMLIRHKQLARFFTALHLHAQFTDDNLTPEDVLAGIWSFKSGTALDGLSHVNLDGIIQKLEPIMSDAAPIVNNYEKSLSEQFESVKSAVIDNWNRYQTSDEPPEMDDFEPESVWLLFSKNQAQEALNRLWVDFTNKDDIKAVLDTWHFGSALSKCSEVLWDSLIKSFLKIERNTIEKFVESMGIIYPLCQKSDEISNVSKMLSASKDYASKIASISHNTSAIKHMKSDDKVQLANMRLDDNVDYDLSNIDEDLENSLWLKILLDETDISGKLNLHGTYFAMFDDEFNQFRSDVRSLLHELTEIFRLVSSFDKPDSSFASKSEITARCFDVKQCGNGFKFSPEQFSHFPEEWPGLRRDFERIQKGISEFPDRDYVLEELSTRMSEFYKDKASFNKSETQRLLEKYKPFYERLVMEKSLNMTNFLLETTEDVYEWKKKVSLFNDDCKSAFDIEAWKLRLIQNGPIIYSGIQERDLVSKLKKLNESIPTMRKHMSNLREAVENMKQEKPTNARKLKFKNRDNLLRFSSAVYCLEKIKNIDEMDKELGIFIEKGDEVVKAVESTKSENKQRLEKIWGDWPEVKEDLKRFRKSVTEMMAQIRDISEKSLERVGQVYYWISAVRLQGSFDLKKYRESLPLLDQNPVPVLEKALQKLEEPMSMDWDLVHMNFRRMPEVMRELQKDFDCFFDEYKCPEELQDRSMIMMERYRKNQEKFYKIDLRKQLLSLAYGWSMAMGPPGLLLLTWLWIIGKFNKHYYGNDDDYETDSETDDSDSDWDDGYTSTDSNESNTVYY
ncbi:hypothetical protein CAEBREN_23349 [Caenorhabditis brenneri]|uniref:Domain of unknown function WSN domain-containing protein n=1 Tax=Caenorhabditis brenneri TaxID=135651 RepID=G0N300_CAEBE|nr:hypothetical protein CAEBREN_23349 [Caenorhabditis brenneri]